MFYSFKSDHNFDMNMKEEDIKVDPQLDMNPVPHRFAVLSSTNWVSTIAQLSFWCLQAQSFLSSWPRFGFDFDGPKQDYRRAGFFETCDVFDFWKNRFLLLEKNVFFEAWTLLPTDLQSPFCQKSSEVAKKLKLQKYRLKLRGCRKSKVTEQITTKQIRNYQLVVNVINFLLFRLGKFPDFPQKGGKAKSTKLISINFYFLPKFSTPMGLRQLQMALLVPYDSLLHFSHLKISFTNQNKTSFILDKCWHLTLCSHLIQPNWKCKTTLAR